MMGFGHVGSESIGLNSSNFSNLSALAPPFNRLNPNPNSNPILQYPESTYAFEPFSQTWQYASPSAPTSEQVVDSTGMTNMPFSNDYQFSASMSSAHLYSPYVPPMDPLVENDGLRYDMGPTSQIDYVQSLQDLGYGPKWADNLRFNEGKRAKRVELDAVFSSEKTNIGGSRSYNNQPYHGLGIGYGTTYKEDTDVHTRSVGKGRLEDKSFLEQDLSFLSYESNKTYIPAPNLEPRPFDVSCEINNIFSNYQNSSCSTYENRGKSSPAVVIRPPPSDINAGGSNCWDFSNSNPSKNLDQKSTDYEIKSRLGPQLANTNGFNSVEVVNSAVESPDFIVDSPCWKGAPSSRLSSLDIEAGTHVKKKMDEYCSFDSTRICSGGEGNKNSRNGISLTLDTTLDSIYPSKEKGSSEVSTMTNDPKSNNLKCGFGEEKSCTIFNDISKGSSVAVRAAEKVLDSPSSQEDLTEGSKLQLEPRLDVPTMIKAIHNLSELLLFHLSNDSCVIEEEYIETLKHSRDNLDLCMRKKIFQTINDPEPNNFVGDTSKKFGEFHNVNKILGSPHMTNEASNSPFQFDYWSMNDEKKNCSISDKKDEKSQVFSPLGDDLDITKDDDMAKAIKNVLDENFNFNEEMHSQTLLFKNLWLEAEAKLCAISYKARFDRMKIEMEKSKPKSPKENEDVAQTMSKLHVLPTVSEPSMPDISLSSTSLHAGDTSEASIMSRFNILKSREDNLILKKPMNVKEEQQKEPEIVDGDSVSTVMSRFNVLKSREDKLKSINVEEEQPPPPETSFKDESEDETLDKFGLHSDGFGYESRKSTMIDSFDQVKIINQYYVGGLDSSSSDWEHVPKDDFAWKNLET